MENNDLVASPELTIPRANMTDLGTSPAEEARNDSLEPENTTVPSPGVSQSANVELEPVGSSIPLPTTGSSINDAQTQYPQAAY